MDDLDEGPPQKQQRGEYRCDICDTSFTHRRTLLRHQRENAQHLEKTGLLASERPVCELCYRSFSRVFDLLRRRNQVHGGQKRTTAQATRVEQTVFEQAVAIMTIPRSVEPRLYHSPAMSPLWTTDSDVPWYDHEPSSDVDMSDRVDDSSPCSSPPHSLGKICQSIYDKFTEASTSPSGTIMLLRRRSSRYSLSTLTPASEVSDSWCDLYFQDPSGTRHRFWSCELLSGVPLPILALPTVVVLRQEQLLSARHWLALPGRPTEPEKMDRQ